MAVILAYDIGTTGVKTCLYNVGSSVDLMGAASEGYELYTIPGGGAEQHADEWWDAICKSTAGVLEKTGADPADIDGITFCSQMQGLVLVDEEGVPVRHPMSYMDQRASEEMKEGIGTGVKIAGMNAEKLLKSLQITGVAAGSVKDPIWRYVWVKNHEPENYSRVKWWLDVKEYVIGRMTGKFVMTEDSAWSTMLYDTRKKSYGWSSEMCDMFGIDISHMPPVIKTSDVAGTLREEQAAELGLRAGTPVYGGGGDASLIGIGAGCVKAGQTHMYCGTSGWVSTLVKRQKIDTENMIGGGLGAVPGLFSYFAEMETAGKCLEWVKDHLAKDEIGVYMDQEDIAGSKETVYESLYDYMSEVIGSCPAGAGGVIFTPWLHGNRCPFEDHLSRGMFFNISLDTGKTEMLRAVTEGVCYHLRWMLECEDKKIKTSKTIRFVGGGALSPVTCQILADITGRTIETVASPQNAGAVGAALTAAVGMGAVKGLAEAAGLIPVTAVYRPNKEDAAVYDRSFEVFKNLYRANKRNFEMMNGLQPAPAQRGSRKKRPETVKKTEKKADKKQ